jgi:hypothetical protein
MADDTITIITTIHPAKNGKRSITVAAAPDDQAPRFTLGSFADRHKLLDQAYGEALKREAKADAKAAKPKSGKGGKHGAEPSFGQPGHLASSGKAAGRRKQLPGHVSGAKVAEVLERAVAEIGADAPAEETGPIPAQQNAGLGGPGVPEAPEGLPVIEGDEDAAEDDGKEQLELELESSNGD